MAGFKLNLFKGLRPRISATKLQFGEAITATNVKLGSGDLEPIPDKATVQAVGTGRQSRSIYLFDNAGSPIWFEWDDYVDVVRGPVKDDSIERTYYTGDTTGNGAPKLTTTALADLGNGGPYPESWLYIGVPVPVLAPTITPPAALPEALDSEDRFARNLKSFELVIDRVQWTVYPGNGTRNQTWRPNSAASGRIAFAADVGTSLRVRSVINANKVTVESETEPGISLRTVNSDKTTVNDWQPMDEQGTAGANQEADFVGWRIPPGMQVTIPGHGLVIGDLIVISAINADAGMAMALATDFYEQAWDVEEQVDEAGTTFRQVSDARVSPSAVTGDLQWAIDGSFYYDVDRSGSTQSELEDRSYVYTYVNSLGEEGPPSPASSAQAILDGRTVLVSAMSLPPTIGYDITLMRLYRTNSTEAGTEFQFVKEFNVSRTTTDVIKSADLQEVITSTTWDAPPAGMLGITTMPNGMLVGFKGKQLYFCEPYFPHAWPAEYDQAVDYDIVGLASFGNSVVALTEGWPYIVTGAHPRNANIRPIKINQACVNKESIATDGDKVYYASPDGIVEIGINGIRLATEDILDKSDWATYSPSTLVAEFYEGRYYGFYDFDVSVVEAVITAEISGTITDADESDIINGSETIIITLTNDNWIPLGSSFNAQRQNIIDGFDATADPTLGWNNILRDTELVVANVVRTSDTVVTITLPTASGYAITAAETIQLTIPNAALLNGNSDLTTSTFTIEPDEPSATVSLSGTLDGASEANVVTGTKTIIITLTNDTWETTLTTAMNQLIIDGLKASTDEAGGWNDEVTQLITTSAVVRTNDTVVTVTLPAIADYSVVNNEQITAVVPHSALVLQEDVDANSNNSLGIIATGAISALFSGTVVSGGVTEAEIVTGGDTIIITLTNDTWSAQGTGPIGSTANTQAIIDALVSQTDQGGGWNATVPTEIETNDVVRTSDTICTITLDAIAAYSIADDETIGMTIPAGALTSGDSFNVLNTFGITSQTPITVTLTGTIADTIDETDIVAGGKTIILTVFDDTWLAAGSGPVGSTANTQAIIDGLTANTSPTNGWNNEIRDGSLGTGNVVRTSDTVVTITVPADVQYDVSSTETIIATIPAAALNISPIAVVASPTFDILFVTPASAVVTGSIISSANESDVIAGGKEFIITLSNDNWVAEGATFNAIRQDIIDILSSAQSEGGGWNTKVRDVMDVTTVVRTAATIVTITLPETSDYVITANETITVKVPASALVTSVIEVTATPTVLILNQATPTSAVLSGTVTDTIDESDIVTGAKTLILTLSDDTWLDAGASFEATRQSIIDGLAAATSPTNGWDNELIGSGGSGSLDTTDVVRTSSTIVTITLPADAEYSITADETITATIPASALSTSEIAVVAAPTFVIDNLIPATTAVLSGTITASVMEVVIVDGAETIILTLTNDTWLSPGTGPIGSTANTQALIDGISAAGTPINGWNNEVRDGSLTPSQVVRTSNTICTITLAADAEYSIIADETITATIPAVVLDISAIAVVAAPTFVITHNCTHGTSAIGNLNDEDIDGPAPWSVAVKWDSDGDVYFFEGTVDAYGDSDSTWIGDCANTEYEGRWTKTSGNSASSNTFTENVWTVMSATMELTMSIASSGFKDGSFLFELRRLEDQTVVISDTFSLIVGEEEGE